MTIKVRKIIRIKSHPFGNKKNNLKTNSSNLIKTALSATLIHSMDESIELFENITICDDTFLEEPIMPPIFELECDLNPPNKMSVCALSVINLINSKNMSKNKIITVMRILIKR